MSMKEVIAWIFGGVVAVILALIGGHYVLKMHEVDAQINAQTEVQRTEIEEKAATQRTRERMHWLPWYSDEKNELDTDIGSE